MIDANKKLVNLYYNIGKMLEENSSWGNKFIDNVAMDLKMSFPNLKKFSVRNLKYMKTFCNKHIKEFKNMSQDKIEEYRKLFKETVDKVYTIFGKNAFRRLTKVEGKNDYEWSKTRINLALYDIQMFEFTRYDKEALIRHQDEIRDKMFDLMVNDQDFINSIEKETSNSTTVNYRFSKWSSVLADIMKQENDNPNPRCFPDSIKTELFNQDPTCKLCGQRILNYDDAHVDHIKPYANGGLTVRKNAQLAHRFCNQHKSNKELS